MLKVNISGFFSIFLASQTIFLSTSKQPELRSGGSDPRPRWHYRPTHLPLCLCELSGLRHDLSEEEGHVVCGGKRRESNETAERHTHTKTNIVLVEWNLLSTSINRTFDAIGTTSSFHYVCVLKQRFPTQEGEGRVGRGMVWVGGSGSRAGLETSESLRSFSVVDLSPRWVKRFLATVSSD